VDAHLAYATVEQGSDEYSQIGLSLESQFKNSASVWILIFFQGQLPTSG